MSELDGRVALVTGAARGIGAAIAERLARDGAAVAVLDLDAEAATGTVDAIKTAGGTAIAIGADVSNEASVADAVERVVAELGGLHILVNNAGVLRDNLLFKMSQDDWDTVMNVHLRGAFLCCRAAQQHMVNAKFGRIVNLSSVSALGNRGQANYSAAKAGLQGFTRTLAIELGPFGMTVNAAAPGFVETAMTRSTAERMGTTIEEMRGRFEQVNPVRRGGVPDDIAHTVSFFASPGAGYITGQTLYIDGGRRLL